MIALVTGAGSGIGKAATFALVNAGHTVIAVGRRRDALDATAAAASDPARVDAQVCDVTQPDSVAALFKAVESQHGRLDLLFNNAGVFSRSVPIDELSIGEFTQAVATNVTGAFLCARAAVALMKRQRPRGGRIINNGSISAYTPRPLSVAYTTTKHAITGMTKAIALEGRGHDIACGQIDIGNAETEMTAKFGGGALQADGTRKAEPLMHVDHAASAVVYMASLPLSANVQFMTVLATEMPYIGRG
jgi:NAD(P)-dependent dehydrogenase (short-subunit alcohol dehydrogenase family)